MRISSFSSGARNAWKWASVPNSEVELESARAMKDLEVRCVCVCLSVFAVGC